MTASRPPCWRSPTFLRIWQRPSAAVCPAAGQPCSRGRWRCRVWPASARRLRVRVRAVGLLGLTLAVGWLPAGRPCWVPPRPWRGSSCSTRWPVVWMPATAAAPTVHQGAAAASTVPRHRNSVPWDTVYIFVPTVCYKSTLLHRPSVGDWGWGGVGWGVVGWKGLDAHRTSWQAGTVQRN